MQNHTYRSFQGVICLYTEISTRQADYTVDTMRLGEEVCYLNEVFTDPKILKVSHLIPITSYCLKLYAARNILKRSRFNMAATNMLSIIILTYILEAENCNHVIPSIIFWTAAATQNTYIVRAQRPENQVMVTIPIYNRLGKTVVIKFYVLIL